MLGWLCHLLLKAAILTSLFPPLIVAEQLGLSYRGADPALTSISLSIPAGEFIALLGPSGCGKSTLLRLFAGLLTPTSGTLTIHGQPPAVARKRDVRMAYVFQDPTLLPWRPVVENIRLPLELQQVPVSRHAELIQGSLQLIGLKPDDLRKRPRNLSGGMRMRVSLARALVTNPQFLLLDEPFAALDDMHRQQLNEDLVRIWREQGWTGVFVTHNVAEAVFLSQRILILSRRPGTIAAEVQVPFPCPREPALRGTAEFARVTAEVAARLREAAS